MVKLKRCCAWCLSEAKRRVVGYETQIQFFGRVEASDEKIDSINELIAEELDYITEYSGPDVTHGICIKHRDAMLVQAGIVRK